MNFFKLYIGDYQRDTAHLSITEHGAYLLMLQHYYATENPLPIGKALHRMLRADIKAERAAIDAVAAQFWRTTAEGLVNERADDEITKAGGQAETNRRIAREREAKRKAERKEHESSTNRSTIDQPNQTPDTRHQTYRDSVPDGTAAVAAPSPPPDPPPAKPLSAKDRLWALGVALLGDKGRAWLGKAVATFGEAVVLEGLVACNDEQPGGDLKGWLTKAFEARAKASPKPAARVNGVHAGPTTEDLLNRDPRPAWAVQAGFADIWAAESAGCGPGNAAQFRDGRRVVA